VSPLFRLGSANVERLGVYIILQRLLGMVMTDKPEKDIKTRFSDVLGIDEFKEELLELVDFLKNPEKY